MKKVLFVMQSLYGGGAEKSLVNLLNVMPKDEFDIDILLFRKEGMFLSQVPNWVGIIDTPESIKKLYSPVKKAGLFAIVKLFGTLLSKVLFRNPREKEAFRWKYFYSPFVQGFDKKYDVACAYISGEVLYGGFNRINFGPDGYEVLPVIISPERKKQLNNNLMMFFTGFTRFSSDMQKANNVSAANKIAQLKEMYALVDEAEKVLTNKERDIDDFGRLLDHTWKLKKRTGAKISTNSIDLFYDKGIQAGALGGKLLGAGGGGFLLFYVRPEKQEAVREAMKELMYIPFEFENGGTRVIHYSPEAYEPRKNTI